MDFVRYIVNDMSLVNLKKIYTLTYFLKISVNSRCKMYLD